MTRISINVKVISEVVPEATIDRNLGRKVITSCVTCGGIYFYQVVEHNYEDSKIATDTCIYCVQCGELNSGYINDPLDELESLKG